MNIEQISYTKFRGCLASFLNKITKSNLPICINRQNYASNYLISEEFFEYSVQVKLSSLKKEDEAVRNFALLTTIKIEEVSYTKFRRYLANHLNKTTKSNLPVRITRKNQTSVYLVSEELFEYLVKEKSGSLKKEVETIEVATARKMPLKPQAHVQVSKTTQNDTSHAHD